MPKILLCGNDKELIDSLFSLEKDSLMFMSTTENPEDIRRHLKMFIPKAFVFCLKNQSEDSLEKISSILEYIQAANTKLFLVGDDSEMDVVFSKFGADKVHGTYARELGVDVIIERLKSLEEEDILVPASSNSVSDFSDIVPIENLEGLDALDILQNMMNQPQPATKAVSEKKKVLVVDDDPNMLRTLKLYLQDDFSVAVANSGQVALKFLEERVVDIILLDYMMPTMDGPTTLSHIRNSVLTYKIPVIFLTGVSDRDKIRQILTMKVQGYLLKPIDNKKLHEIINKVLSGESLYRSY